MHSFLGRGVCKYRLLLDHEADTVVYILLGVLMLKWVPRRGES